MTETLGAFVEPFGKLVVGIACGYIGMTLIRVAWRRIRQGVR